MTSLEENALFSILREIEELRGARFSAFYSKIFYFGGVGYILNVGGAASGKRDAVNIWPEKPP